MTSPRRRVGVYNRYWSSRGGGERHVGMIAQVLSANGADVDLIGHEKVNLAELQDYLGLDLGKCRLRIVPDMGELAMSELTAEYDLLVNGSYMSRLESRARKSVYLCYFPTPSDHDLEPWRRYAIRKLGRYVRPPQGFVDLTWGTGWFPPEGGRRRKWTWTSGDAAITLAPGAAVSLRFDLARPGSEPTQLTVSVGDDTLVVATAGDRFRPVRVTVPASLSSRTVRFRCAAFNPGGSDHRQLGVAVSRIRFSGSGLDPRERIGMRFPWLLRDPTDVRYLDTYDLVLSNSQYTTGWIDRLWRRPAEVLYPPIQVERLQPEPNRERSIVSAGRFFAPGQGHSKRQLELVRAYAQLVESGRLDGWTLHLIGGCEKTQRRYLDTVRAAATGLPVEIHENAPRHLLEHIMSTATIQWSATGFGEDESKAPWASEHFGMTTVEAMAGGCVPIVIDKAGQREIVRDGVDGYRWSTLDQLIERTLEVATDDELRSRLAGSAVKRAQQYSDAAFADHVNELVDRHGLL